MMAIHHILFQSSLSLFMMQPYWEMENEPKAHYIYKCSRVCSFSLMQAYMQWQVKSHAMLVCVTNKQSRYSPAIIAFQIQRKLHGFFLADSKAHCKINCPSLKQKDRKYSRKKMWFKWALWITLRSRKTSPLLSEPLVVLLWHQDILSDFYYLAVHSAPK